MLSQESPDFQSHIVLLSSDEPLLIRDWLDAARARLREQGFEDIQSYQHDRQFDWNFLMAESQSMSLFSSQKCSIVQFASNKPGQVGGRMLQQWCDSPTEDHLLILVMSRLDGNSRKSAWFKRVQKSGQVIELATVYPNQLIGWIQQRATAKSLSLDSQAAAFLAEKTEGNLLAADQDLEKLVLLGQEGKVLGLEDVANVTAENARFDQFALADACLAGKTRRALKIARNLHAEGYVTIPLQSWLFRIVQNLLKLKQAQGQGGPNDQDWRSAGIWRNQQGLYRQALQRLNPVAIERLLRSCAKLERLGKGQQPGAFDDQDWLQLEQFILEFCHPNRAV